MKKRAEDGAHGKKLQQMSKKLNCFFSEFGIHCFSAFHRKRHTEKLYEGVASHT